MCDTTKMVMFILSFLGPRHVICTVLISIVFMFMLKGTNFEIDFRQLGFGRCGEKLNKKVSKGKLKSHLKLKCEPMTVLFSIRF